MSMRLQTSFHPSMRLPFMFDEATFNFEVKANTKIWQLMALVERQYERSCLEIGMEVQFQVQVMWNTKNTKQPLNPSLTVGNYLRNGDTFGVYGDALRVDEPRVAKLEEQKLPVTILTGFLGAGKTTLLNYILQEQKEKRIAVIENEFGAVSIDDALLGKEKLALAEKVVVMNNGCMCCQIRGDIAVGLKQILDDIKNGGKIDQIIIETTGMADPVPIVRTFMTNTSVTGELRLDGVVAVADAKHILARLDDSVEEGKVNEAYQQIAFCDKILLNKLDLVSADQAMKVKDRLRSINAYAKILPAVKSRCKVSELTNMRAHDISNFANADIEKEAESEQGPASKKFRHDSRVNSCSFTQEGDIDPELLRRWMQSIAQLPKEEGIVFRMKAILSIKGHPNKHVFHAVMDVSDEDDAGPWGKDEKRVSKMVFIGKGLNKAMLKKGFEDLFSKC